MCQEAVGLKSRFSSKGIRFFDASIFIANDRDMIDEKKKMIDKNHFSRVTRMGRNL